MAVSDPTKPWAIVLCSLEGSSGDPQVAFDLEVMFRPGSAAIFDYWHDQSVGHIDVSDSDLFGWYPCGWTVLGTSGEPAYPGITQSPQRATYHDHAVEVLKARNPGIDLGHYRGVLSVFNFPVGGGNIDTNVVYGLNGLGGDLTWAERTWRRCRRCSGLVQGAKAGLPCPVQNTPGTTETHDLSTSIEYLVATNAHLAQSTSGFLACSRCGGLYVGDPSGCPAGGKHQAVPGKAYVAMTNWSASLGETGWQSCTACGLVFRVDNGFGSLRCPATNGAHTLNAGMLSFCFVDYSYNRTFLMHEMGHAYGFHHGRDTRPDSWDINDECVPGGYGDLFDIMSAMNCYLYMPSDPRNDSDFRFGSAGPGLSVHHLLDKDLLDPAAMHQMTQPTQQTEVLSLRPTTRPDLPGYAAVQAGELLVEFRHCGRRQPDGTVKVEGWDRSFPIGNSPGCVLVYDLSGASPAVLPGTTGRAGLVAGDRFESRVGLGSISITVGSIDDAGEYAEIRVEVEPGFVNGWQRWLVLPCQYPDAPAAPKTIAQIAGIFGAGVEGFWQTMANGAFPTGGGFVVSSQGSIGDAWIPLRTTWAQDVSRDPKSRVRQSVQEALALKNPTNANTPFYLDWRYFTGIILLRNVALGEGWTGEIGLSSGNSLKTLPYCPKEVSTGDAAGPLPYRVIEIGSDSITQAGLAAAIGRSLGLEDLPEDPFDLMGTAPNTYRYMPSGAPRIGNSSWGPIGPGLSSDSLTRLGWLPSDRVFVAEVPQGQHWTSGTVTLAPLTKAAQTPGYVRAEIGGFSLEVRTSESWDSGLPEPVVVLARGAKGTTVLHQGGSISSGGLIPELTGSTSVTVNSLTTDAAVLEYTVQEGTEIVVGGGHLGGGGTLLFTPSGSIIRIPPGDPWERRLADPLNRISGLIDEITRTRTSGEP